MPHCHFEIAPSSQVRNSGTIGAGRLMTDVFLSYKREERDAARRLAEAIQKHGFSVWWDAEILPGEQYRAVTLEILQNCRAAVVIWSPLSVKSSWVLDEAQRALDRGVLVPVHLEKISAYPLGFGQVHAHDLTTWDGDPNHAALKPVIAAMQRLAGAPGDKEQKSSSQSEIEVEVAFWRGVQDSRDASGLEAYLKRYPSGLFSELARARIGALKPQDGAKSAAPRTRKRKTAAPEAVPQSAPPQAAPQPVAAPASSSAAFSVHELAFIAACMYLTVILAWPVTNTILAFDQTFYPQDVALMLSINHAQGIFVMPLLLIGLAWGYDRAKAWWASRGRSVQVLQNGVLAVLVLWFLMSLAMRVNNGRETHLALCLLSLLAAATYARPAVAWLRPRIERSSPPSNRRGGHRCRRP